MKDQLTLIRFFKVCINKEGFWNYNQVALRVKDIVNVLIVKFYNKNVDFLIDQSCIHGCMRDRALNTIMMSVRFRGERAKLQKTILKDVGTYNKILSL